MSTESLDFNQLSARLGHPCETAQAVTEAGDRRRFARRHPILTFFVLPVPLLVVLWIAYGLALVGLLSGFEAYRSTPWALRLASLLIHGIAYVPPVLLTLLVAWVAIRSEAGKVWWVVGAALITLLSGMLAVSLTLPTTPGSGRLSVGLGFPPPLVHWPQALVPLLLTALFMTSDIVRRNRRPARPALK